MRLTVIATAHWKVRLTVPVRANQLGNSMALQAVVQKVLDWEIQTVLESDHSLGQWSGAGSDQRWGCPWVHCLAASSEMTTALQLEHPWVPTLDQQMAHELGQLLDPRTGRKSDLRMHCWFCRGARWTPGRAEGRRQCWRGSTVAIAGYVQELRGRDPQAIICRK